MASRFPRRVDLLALDLAELFLRFVDRFPDCSAITIDGFLELYDKSHIEYLFFCGCSSLDVPYHDYVVNELLQLSASYLSLPSALTRPHVRPFSLLLTYTLYATQPSMYSSSGGRHFQIRLAVDLMEDLLRSARAALPSSDVSDVSTSLASLSCSTRSEGCGVKVPALSHAELHVLCALHSHHAFMLEPFLDTRAYLAAIITAHDAIKAPLLRLGDIRSQLLDVSRTHHVLRGRGVTQHAVSSFSSSGRASSTVMTAPRASPCLLSSQAFASDLAEYDGLRRLAGI